MKKTFMRVAAVAVICAITGSASGCYFFPEEEKLLDPPVLKVEDVTYSTYKAVKKTIVNKASATGYCVSEVQQDCSFTERDGTLKDHICQSRRHGKERRPYCRVQYGRS